MNQGRIHGQEVVADGWAGAFCRWAGAVIKWAGAICSVGRGNNAHKSLIRPILRRPKFRVTDIPTNQGTHPLIESLSQRLITNPGMQYWWISRRKGGGVWAKIRVLAAIQVF